MAEQPYKTGATGFARSLHAILEQGVTMAETDDRNSATLLVDAEGGRRSSATIDHDTELEAIANRLLELMKLMHPLDLAAALYMVNCISDPNEYKEYNQRGTPAYVQYIAQLGLTQPPSPLGGVPNSVKAGS